MEGKCPGGGDFTAWSWLEGSVQGRDITFSPARGTPENFIRIYPPDGPVRTLHRGIYSLGGRGGGHLWGYMWRLCPAAVVGSRNGPGLNPDVGSKFAPVRHR